MKNLTLIVHADVQQALADTLRSIKQASGFTFTPVEGHGAQDGRDAVFSEASGLSAKDRVVGYTPQVRVDILLEDGDVNVVLQMLRITDCGLAGRGIYWVTSVEQRGRL